MTVATPPGRMTVAEYLAMESASQDKHVFWDGAIYAMAGASVRHNLLVARILRHLGNRLDGSPCQPFGSDQRIRVQQADRYFYPDLSVVCRPFQVDVDDELSLVNPRLLGEVLSPSTEAFDRGEKFVASRGIPSLTDYLLMSQQEPRAEHYVREADGTWRLHTLGSGDRLAIVSLDLEIAVSDLYDRLE